MYYNKKLMNQLVINKLKFNLTIYYANNYLLQNHSSSFSSLFICLSINFPFL